MAGGKRSEEREESPIRGLSIEEAATTRILLVQKRGTRGLISASPQRLKSNLVDAMLGDCELTSLQLK